MAAEDLVKTVIVIFVVLAFALAVSEYLIGIDLSGLIDPLQQIFVPIFLVAVFAAMIISVFQE